MLFLLGEKENLMTLRMLTKPYFPTSAVNMESQRITYQKLLHVMQPEVPHSNSRSPSYVTGTEVVTQLSKLFSMESQTDDTPYDIGDLTRRDDSDRHLQFTKSCAYKLANLYPPFGWLYNLVIDSVFHAPSNIAAGGTTSGAVGILWIDAREDWTNRDMYEFLVHELSHTLLFIHEWAHGLFTSQRRLTESETYAMSAIRGQIRPMDKAFHSAIVATDVLLLREKIIGHDTRTILHPSTSELIPQIFDSIRSIQEVDARQGILTDYAQKLLGNCLSHLSVLA
ncbi:hypothetical protein AAC03nite_39410 [Alicyclobacillus acidoterrestris]|nr:hypothetical protein AAC03nite_39410 [Alicyclobacillus acidoterrestris]